VEIIGFFSDTLWEAALLEGKSRLEKNPKGSSTTLSLDPVFEEL
jgi:hypothetical protein